MEKSEKLIKVLEQYIKSISALEAEEAVQKTALMYENGMHLLLTDHKKQIVARKKAIQDLKIVKPAKALMLEFDVSGLNIFLNFSELLEKHIMFDLNLSNLLPFREKMLKTLSSDYDTFLLKLKAFYYSSLLDIFNQGRQHQMTLDKKVDLKKFMIFEYEEHQAYETFFAGIEDEALKFAEKVSLEVKDKIIEVCRKRLSNKSEFCDTLNILLSKYNQKLKNLLSKNAWQAYSWGNLYQLEKDGEQLVVWKTQHLLTDCGFCRAYETGKFLLPVSGGYLDAMNFRSVYPIGEIKNTLGFEAPSMFTHADCRCFFSNLRV